MSACLLYDARCTRTDVYRVRINSGGEIGERGGIFFARGYPGEKIVTITFVDGRLKDTDFPPVEAFDDLHSWWNCQAAIAAKVKELQAAYAERSLPPAGATRASLTPDSRPLTPPVA